MVSRLLRRAKAALGEAASGLKEAFRSRVRSRPQAVPAVAPDRPPQEPAGPRRIEGGLWTARQHVAKRTGAQGRRVLEALQASMADDPACEAAGRTARGGPAAVEAGYPPGRERRVLENDPVPAPEKLLSLFEPHTQVIPRFKAGKPVEFGRKIRLDEVEGGIITGYSVLEKGGGQDQPHLGESLAKHKNLFGRSTSAAGGGPWDVLVGQRATGEGVRAIKHVALPHVGKAPPERRAEEKGASIQGGLQVPSGDRGPDPRAEARLWVEAEPVPRRAWDGPVGGLGSGGPQPVEGLGSGVELGKVGGSGRRDRSDLAGFRRWPRSQPTCPLQRGTSQFRTAN